MDYPAISAQKALRRIDFTESIRSCGQRRNSASREESADFPSNSMGLEQNDAFEKSEIPPIRLNNDLADVSCPANGVLPRKERWKITAHAAVHAGCVLIGFHERGVQRNAVRDAVQFHNGHAHHEGNFAGTIHRDNWLGIDAAAVGDERAGGRECNLRHILLIPEGLAAEVHGE